MTVSTGIMIESILTELILLVLTGIVLISDILFVKENKRQLGWITIIGLVISIVAAFIWMYPATMEGQLVWGNMLRFDMIGFVFRLVFLSGAAITILFALGDDNLSKRGEFYILLLISVIGMNLMASSADLIMLYLSIETASIPLFVLAGFVITGPKSVEAGIKYLLFGAMASAIMLYGFSFLYGFSGDTTLVNIAGRIAENGIPTLQIVFSLVLVVIGLGFKISIFPMHFWAPDVYEGAPTSVTGFLSTASKAAGFSALIPVLILVFPEIDQIWMVLISVLSVASMFIGNLLAITQKNIKRLLAYSSIAHAGYILIGVVAWKSSIGVQGVIYYLMGYLLTNIAAFGIVTIIGRTIGSDEISAYAGLSRRSPWLALAMLVVLLSLGGIPPFAGFVGKLLVFGAAIDVNMAWLAIIGIINAVIGMYYYLTILKVIYLNRSEDEEKPVRLLPSWQIGVVVCIIGIIALGVIIAPWFGWTEGAVLSLLSY